MASGATLKQPVNQLNVLGYRKARFALMQRNINLRHLYNLVRSLVIDQLQC